ncbi:MULTISPECIES: permease prefix domain 1-containing protein [Clostridium]|uniref:Uncharacterized protein n=3 Tax=Clostridium TaxID=1485 RepID=A0A3M0S4D6_9CLOT|nr:MULTISPECIES: permease prefix domain 1-containing protein [Clostridium]ADK16470.1 putative membrane protein [Clostridium ljungdahlii DSM 13528]AGY75549.1 permease prefix domain 1-containing protein [Clostridium autoethanogenum DSM 10061]ALU35714.1 Hypothetical protein CLAU_1285 [Clostridium autoethanogenum DSM 10061]OAA89654.1 hypothetical protein WX45_01490 [Clostridium ljungdahlii DSM 13528]OVY52224.1 hypothetical protein WX72_01120 [Clostridium autoethanogenum]
MDRINNYIKQIYKSFNDKDKDVKILKEEMKTHLNERTKELQSKGLNEDDSIDIAIKEFGPVKEVDAELSLIISKQKKFWKYLFLCAIVIYLIGAALSLIYNKNRITFLKDGFGTQYYKQSSYIIKDELADILKNEDNFSKDTEKKITEKLDKYNSQNNNGIYYCSVWKDHKKFFSYNKENEIPISERDSGFETSFIYANDEKTLKYNVTFKYTHSQDKLDDKAMDEYGNLYSKTIWSKFEYYSYIVYFASWIVFAIAFLGIIYSERKLPIFFIVLVFLETCGLFCILFDDNNHGWMGFMSRYTIAAIVITGLIAAILCKKINSRKVF